MEQTILKAEVQTDRVGFQEFVSNGYDVETLILTCSCGHEGDANHFPRTEEDLEVYQCQECGASAEPCEVEELLKPSEATK